MLFKRAYTYLIYIILIYLCALDNIYASLVITKKIDVHINEEFTLPVAPYPAPILKMELNEESSCIRNNFIALVNTKDYHYSIYDNPPKFSQRILTFKAIKSGKCRLNVIVYRIYNAFNSTHSHAFEINIDNETSQRQP
jgi:hypothetical protein